jgi:hypothetical protein
MQIRYTERLLVSQPPIRLPLCSRAFVLFASVAVLSLATVPAREALLPSSHCDHAPHIRARATRSSSNTKSLTSETTCSSGGASILLRVRNALH